MQHDIKFVNVEKQGSLIIGDYRCGSHFVQRLCQHQAIKLKINCAVNDEWKSDDESIFKKLEKNHRDKYQIFIVNHVDKKIKILESHWANDWYVIRIIHDDIYRWFISLYFFVISPEFEKISDVKDAKVNNQGAWFVGNGNGGDYYSKDNQQYIVSWNPDLGNFQKEQLIGTKLSRKNIHHHGTDIGIYRDFISKHKLLPLPTDFWTRIQQHLYSRFLTSMIPADIEFNYSDLHLLSNPFAPWTPNQYPDLDIEKDFEDGIYIKSLLDRWKNPLLSKFKDTK